MSVYGEHANRVNRIQQNIARAEADRIRRRGDFVGGTLAMLGQLPLQILNQRDAQRAADYKAAIEAEELRLRRRNLDLQGQRIEGEVTDRDAKAQQEQEAAKLKQAAQILGVANKQNWGAIRKSVGTAIPWLGENLPEELPPPEVIQNYQRVLVGDLGKPEPAPKGPEGFTLGPGQQRFNPDGTPIATVPPVERPPAEGGFSLAPGGKRFDAQGNVIASVPDRPPSSSGAGGGGALTPAQKRLAEAVIANPAIYDTLTPSAKTDIAAELSARGFKFQTKAESKPATGAQNKVLGFFNRAKQASDDLEQVEDQIAAMGLLGQARDAMAPADFLKSNVGRQYGQSQRAFTEARLRKDSGAAIPAEEFANDRRTYFVVPGDDAVTIENKRRARYALLASMGFESGPALAGFYGEEAEPMIEDYRARSKRKAAGSGAPPPAGAADPLGIR